MYIRAYYTSLNCERLKNFKHTKSNIPIIFVGRHLEKGKRESNVRTSLVNLKIFGTEVF